MVIFKLVIIIKKKSFNNVGYKLVESYNIQIKQQEEFS